MTAPIALLPGLVAGLLPATLDPLGALFYTIFVVGYAMLPYQAEDSIATGRPPCRRDFWAFKGGKVENYSCKHWKRFGIVYGQIRGPWMIPDAIAIALAYPWVKVAVCAARDHWRLDEGNAIVIEQIVMGRFWELICSRPLGES